jgi:UDP-N-acetylmuramoyl-L-alanyl-D-glutamate--2,6-diaminopimelate ligase
MKCTELCGEYKDRLKIVSGGDADFHAVEYDSRAVKHGSLFVAVKGYSSDGHDYVRKAADSGAAAVVVDKSRVSDFTDLGIPVIAAEDSRFALSYVSAAFYGHPSRKMKVIGVTGTNGKTSTTYMIESILRFAGHTPGVIGTVNYRWKDKVLDAPNTTPESADLQKMFGAMHSEGVDAVVMEVSSHGLYLGRADDISFDGAVFSNLTRDHLDFHKTFEEYFSAKCRLFELVGKNGKRKSFGAVNADDEYGRRIIADAPKYGYPILGYGYGEASVYRVDAGSVKNGIQGISYRIHFEGKPYEIKLKLGGTFHVYNSLSAFAACHALGIDDDAIIEGLASLESVPGRFDAIHSKLGFSVVVDYAHTNDALEKLLTSAKGLKPRRVISVFGCGGDRDKTKRPLMGRVACELSDHAIVTSDNPRTEDPNAIIEDILAGIKEYKGKYEVEPDREKAIERAIGMASEGDLVVLAGKGHEDYQIIGKTKHHFDDREIARKLIARREHR